MRTSSAAILACVVGCTFPEVGFGGGGGGEGGSTSTTSASGGSTGTSTSSSTTATGTATTTGSGGGGGANPCDLDNDTYESEVSPCNGNDCDDGNDDVFPGQMGYFTVAANATIGFDYDCDGVEIPEYKTSCTGNCPDGRMLAVTVGANGCGDVGVLYECDLLVTCNQGPQVDPTVQQGCH